jgi:hypothetical protein
MIYHRPVWRYNSAHCFPFLHAYVIVPVLKHNCTATATPLQHHNVPSNSHDCVPADRISGGRTVCIGKHARSSVLTSPSTSPSRYHHGGTFVTHLNHASDTLVTLMLYTFVAFFHEPSTPCVCVLSIESNSVIRAYCSYDKICSSIFYTSISVLPL